MYHIKNLLKYVTFLFFLLAMNLFQAASATDTYKLDIFVDSSQRVVSGTNAITVFNNSKEVLDTLYFLLGLNNSYDTKMKVTEVSTDNDLILPGSTYHYRYLGKETEDRTVYQVSLPNALNPGDSITLKMKFEVSNLSKINNILFLDDNLDDYSLGSWYPRLIPFTNGAWKKRDFLTNNYEINISVAPDEVVAASGMELSTENIKEKGIKKISYKVDNSRAFAFAISKYISPITEELKEGVIIKTYYKTNKSSKWNQAIIDITKDVLLFFNKKFGFFPYKQLSILPGNNFTKGGYADNNLIVLHETLDNFKNQEEAENYLRWYISNYIAKQYFGFYVGESGEFPGWITSGATLYLSSVYLKEKNINNEFYNNLITQYINASRANFNTLVLQPVDELKQTGFDWENVIEKGKAADIFKMLEYNIGRKYVQDSLKAVLEEYKETMINTDLFQSVVEKTSGKQLSWFFKQWVRENKSLDYGVTKIKQNKTGNKYQVKITLKRFGKAIMPVSISVTLKNGSNVFQVWDGNNSEAELTFEYPFPVKSVQLDPAGILPDIDVSNNHMSAPGI
jgi:hypothetical protein